MKFTSATDRYEARFTYESRFPDELLKPGEKHNKSNSDDIKMRCLFRILIPKTCREAIITISKNNAHETQLNRFYLQYVRLLSVHGSLSTCPPISTQSIIRWCISRTARYLKAGCSRRVSNTLTIFLSK